METLDVAASAFNLQALLAALCIWAVLKATSGLVVNSNKLPDTELQSCEDGMLCHLRNVALFRHDLLGKSLWRSDTANDKDSQTLPATHQGLKDSQSQTSQAGKSGKTQRLAMADDANVSAAQKKLGFTEVEARDG